MTDNTCGYTSDIHEAVVIRTPYSPYTDFSCIIQINTIEHTTFCLFFAKEEEDIYMLFTKLSVSSQSRSSLFSDCLTSLLKLCSSEIDQWRVALDKEVQLMERSTGTTSLRTKKQWELHPSQYKVLTREMHAYNTNLIFLASLREFEQDLGAICERTMKAYLKVQGGVPGQGDAQENDESIFEHLLFCMSDSKSRACLIRSLRLRVQSQINLVRVQIGIQNNTPTKLVKTPLMPKFQLYSLISQRDTRTNLVVAEAAQKDSRARRTTALMTLVFLPGTLITASLVYAPVQQLLV